MILNMFSSPSPYTQFHHRYTDIGQYPGNFPVRIGIPLGQIAHGSSYFAIGASVLQIGMGVEKQRIFATFIISYKIINASLDKFIATCAKIM
jgi:hypothetical protein